MFEQLICLRKISNIGHILVLNIILDSWEFQIWCSIRKSLKFYISFSEFIGIFRDQCIRHIVKPRVCDDCFHIVYRLNNKCIIYFLSINQVNYSAKYFLCYILTLCSLVLAVLRETAHPEQSHRVRHPPYHRLARRVVPLPASSRQSPRDHR